MCNRSERLLSRLMLYTHPTIQIFPFTKESPNYRLKRSQGVFDEGESLHSVWVWTGEKECL